MKGGVSKLAEMFEKGQLNNAGGSRTVDTSVDAALAAADANRAIFRFGAEAPAERDARIAAEQAAIMEALRQEEEANQALIRQLLAEEQLEADLDFARQLENQPW